MPISAEINKGEVKMEERIRTLIGYIMSSRCEILESCHDYIVFEVCDVEICVETKDGKINGEEISLSPISQLNEILQRALWD